MPRAASAPCPNPRPLQGACTFGPRLSDEEVRDLATYVEQQAAADWK